LEDSMRSLSPIVIMVDTLPTFSDTTETEVLRLRLISSLNYSATTFLVDC